MATGGSSEDSGYLEIRGEGQLNALKLMNKNLTDRIKILKQRIKGQDADNAKEKRELLTSHKRETDNLKRLHQKALERVSIKSREIEQQENEVTRLKTTIESLETEVQELKNELEKTKKDDKNTREYETLRREISASRNEVKKLRDYISNLEKEVEQKDKQIVLEKERNNDLSKGMATMKADMATIKADVATMRASMTTMNDNVMGKMGEIEDKEQETHSLLHSIKHSLDQINTEPASTHRSFRSIEQPNIQRNLHHTIPSIQGNMEQPNIQSSLEHPSFSNESPTHQLGEDNGSPQFGRNRNVLPPIHGDSKRIWKP